MDMLAIIVTSVVAAPWIIIMIAPLFFTFFLPFVGFGGVLLRLKVVKKYITSIFLPIIDSRLNVLVVDDDYASVLPLVTLLNKSNINAHYVSSGSEMLEALGKKDFDLIVLDSKMPGMSGEASLLNGDKVLNLPKKIPVVFYSGNALRISVPHDLKQFEVKGLCTKPNFIEVKSNVVKLFPNSEESSSTALESRVSGTT